MDKEKKKNKVAWELLVYKNTQWCWWWWWRCSQQTTVRTTYKWPHCQETFFFNRFNVLSSHVRHFYYMSEKCLTPFNINMSDKQKKGSNK